MTRFYSLTAPISGKPVSFRLEVTDLDSSFVLLRGVPDTAGALHYSRQVGAGSMFASGRVDAGVAVFGARVQGDRNYVSAAIVAAVDAALASGVYVTEEPLGDRRGWEDHCEAVWALQVAGKSAEAATLHAAWVERAAFVEQCRWNVRVGRVDEAVEHELAWQAAYARGEHAYGTPFVCAGDVPAPPAGHPASAVLVGTKALADMRAAFAPAEVVAIVESIYRADVARYEAHLAKRAQGPSR